MKKSVLFRSKLNKTFGVYVPYHYDDIFEHYKIADKSLLDTFLKEHKDQVSKLAKQFSGGFGQDQTISW